MAIQKISGVNLNQIGLASKNAMPKQNLALPHEVSHDSTKFSQVSFRGEGCGTSVALISAGACISTGMGDIT